MTRICLCEVVSPLRRKLTYKVSARIVGRLPSMTVLTVVAFNAVVLMRVRRMVVNLIL